MARGSSKEIVLDKVKIDEKMLLSNTVFFGDRYVVFPSVREKAIEYFENINVFDKKPVNIFEVEKLNISVDDIRRMISFVNKTTEGQKIVLLSSFYWADEAQNAMLKVLEETPPNTFIYLFGLREMTFLKTILSRTQKANFKNVNKYFDIAREALKMSPNERLESKEVKRILGLKVVDLNFEKNTENEKKDREAHILFLNAFIDNLLMERDELKLSKDFLEKVLQITTISDIEGGSPHLFIEWLLLSCPQLN